MSGEADFADGPALDVARHYRLRRVGDVSEDLSLFVALLRDVGVPVSVGAALTAVRALDAVSLERRRDVRAALRGCLTAGPEETLLFESAFSAFWSTEVPVLVETDDGDPADPDAGRDDTATDSATEALQLGGRSGEAAQDRARRARYSSLGRREGAVVPFPDRGLEIAELARRLVRALSRSRGRRMRSGEVGELIDLRESLRHNLRFGEELLELRRMRERTDRARIVVLCDVSSSMSPFTPLFLTFVHALTRIAATVETAIFNVELCDVTDVFRRRPLREALAWLADRSVALAGGTKTGHCLYAFNNQIATRGLTGARASAIVLSDGWDVGEPDLLDEQARRLRDQTGRVIWLDPHAAAAGYRPQVRGLTTALPYVDDYLDFSTPDALRELVGKVESSGARR